jgi:dipeptidyl aminopeptidase/acylaminoacyl peptidase
MTRKKLQRIIFTVSALILTTLLLTPLQAHSGDPFTCTDALSWKRATAVDINPDGTWIAYTASVPRSADDEAGGAWSELYLISVKTGEIRPFITGEANVSSPRFSPDGLRLAFRMKRGEEAKTQVWMIPVDGGESIQVTEAESNVISFDWHPDGTKIAYTATTPESEREEKLEDKGYGFIYYEENLKHRNLYLLGVDDTGGVGEAEQLTDDITVWSFAFGPEGRLVAVAATEKNLIDYNYMFKKIHILDLETKGLSRLTDNPGKLGSFAFSPDGSKLVYTAALERKDHAASQVYVIDVTGGAPRNLTPPDFRGHVHWATWRDKKNIAYIAGEGVWTTLSTVEASGGKRKIILHSEKTGVVLYPSAPRFTKDFKHVALIGTNPEVPGDVYYWKRGAKQLKRLTTLNPWITERELGRQEVIRYRARDGLEIEGILVYPVGYREGERYPLIVAVHGGPESHYTNRWLTGYFNPAQVLAGRGYLVFYPNYRASTGYGVKFALEGYHDAAGKEFDDVADGITHLIETGRADPDRVGLGGGSYGGYAAAWFSSYYTQYVKAVCMFVGISDLISKRSTTDIPYEELYVHSGEKLEKMWQQSLERSPIYWAHQSKTAVLILGGTADTRVHPSQSLEYYRRLKMNDHPAVRMVQYPGEGHGNRKQPGRIDVLYRHILWYDWYVKDGRPVDGPLPPLDISEHYGIDVETVESE